MISEYLEWAYQCAHSSWVQFTCNLPGESVWAREARTREQCARPLHEHSVAGKRKPEHSQISCATRSFVCVQLCSLCSARRSVRSPTVSALSANTIVSLRTPESRHFGKSLALTHHLPRLRAPLVKASHSRILAWRAIASQRPHCARQSREPTQPTQSTHERDTNWQARSLYYTLRLINWQSKFSRTPECEHRGALIVARGDAQAPLEFN